MRGIIPAPEGRARGKRFLTQASHLGCMLVLVCLLASCGSVASRSTSNPTPAAVLPSPTPQPLATDTAVPSTAIPSSPTPQPSPTEFSPSPTPAPRPLAWWDDAVFYEVFVRSFYDSDGDGKGDGDGDGDGDDETDGSAGSPLLAGISATDPVSST